MWVTSAFLGCLGSGCPARRSAEAGSHMTDNRGRKVRLFLSKDNIVPGNEWFLRRERPLTPEMVKADFEALHRVIDLAFGEEKLEPDFEKTTARNWVEKVVKGHEDVYKG